MNKRQSVNFSPSNDSPRKRPRPLPVSRSRTFMPYLKFGYERRLPVDRWLEQCRLPSYLHEDPDAYIPTSAQASCVSLMAGESGIEDLGLRISHDAAVDIMGPHVLAGVLREPTLADGIHTFARLIRRESSGMLVWTSFHDEKARFQLEKLLDPDAPGYRQIEWQSLMIMVTMVKLFTGASWKPDRVATTSRIGTSALAEELFPLTRFVHGQPSAFLEFPRAHLGAHLSGHGGRIRSLLWSAQESPTTDPPEDFAESLRRILRSYLSDGYPSLDLAAAIAGVSSRTLQRRLAEDGLSYSTLVDEARFEVATEMLRETEATSLEISLATGYEDSSHFARAFRRVAGCSPTDFRRQSLAA